MQDWGVNGEINGVGVKVYKGVVCGGGLFNEGVVVGKLFNACEGVVCEVGRVCESGLSV